MKHFSSETLLLSEQREKSKAILKCNESTAVYGLALDEKQVGRLLESRRRALKNSGRIEFGEPVLEKLILTFCNSPFLFAESYEETLADLQDAFYEFKTAAAETYGDDALLADMKTVFDGKAQGSVELLSAFSVADLKSNAAKGRNLFSFDDNEEENDKE